MEDILPSSDVVEAFHAANDNVENWMARANLIKPGMILPPYMPLIQNPPLRCQVLGRDIPYLRFDVPVTPDWKSKGSVFVEEPEEKETGSKKGTKKGSVNEIADSLRRIKLGR
ncbi:hypothetical protein ACKAV7_011682 [Fusarium commune]